MNAETGVSRSPDMSKGGFNARTPVFPKSSRLDEKARPKRKKPISGLPEMGFSLEET
jgi:hypothetical protein